MSNDIRARQVSKTGEKDGGGSELCRFRTACGCQLTDKGLAFEITAKRTRYCRTDLN